MFTFNTVVTKSLTKIAPCSADQCGVYPNDYTRFQTDWIRVYQTSYTPTIAPLPWFNVFGALAQAILCCFKIDQVHFHVCAVHHTLF